MIFISFCILRGGLYGQESLRDSSIRMAILQVSYGGALTSRDMAARFGFTSSIGIEAGYKLPSNFYLTGGLRFLFSETVYENDIFRSISNNSGLLLADDGTLSDLRFQQRGVLIPLSIGKIFPIIPNLNPNSGIYIEIGTQFIQHRIHFRTLGTQVAAISGAYRKGYDRLTNGFGLREGFGFRFFDNRGYVNFSIGFELSQNFTQNRRTINLDTGLADKRKRKDYLSGIHASWIFPIYKRAPNKVYFN